MGVENPLQSLTEQLTKLPGIGPKSAQRLAFFFLSLSMGEVREFAEVLVKTRSSIRYCSRCFNIAISDLCFVCANPARDRHSLCVVSEPKDIFAVERMREFRGVYHVLGGLISPIDGIHPEVLRIAELQARLQSESVSEVILAINPTIEGDTTVLYLTKLLKQYPITVSKLAYGLPVGSDIDYADEMTLQKAFQGRTSVS